MQLAELVGLRPVPCAGLLVTLTRRCPLRCAHCSTTSTMSAEEQPAGALLRFARTFTANDRPDVVMLTGGEPLLLPGLVSALAGTVRAAGARSALLSGMFFARGGRVPGRIRAAISAVDHFSASLDTFHEREISRAEVFGAVRKVLDSGVPASFHLTGSGPDDPYLADVTADIRRTFGDQVPMLVNEVRAVGRAAGWAAAGAMPTAAGPGVLPCAMAAWPVVAFDGTVVACCNQDVVDRRPVPAHLRLGHVASDDWAAIRARALGSPVLRMIRTTGPGHLYARYGTEPKVPEHHCTACRRLGERPALSEAVARAGAGPVGELLDREASRLQAQAGPVALVRRWGCAPYAPLVALPAPVPVPDDAR
ncbi:radical SAM protein [Streptomyces sp. NBC_00568]|uniref:radical SAM protein n=1 Tax=Streptomyces sp. NBC_00568 TaxID=2975779 RepID=UPI002256A2C2|nr:radical SAM protein [Streptomyces sp. NBC_00568]MCX4993674.1 radical SAM protein [Streptomyces sp. NBC_00568]